MEVNQTRLAVALLCEEQLGLAVDRRALRRRRQPGAADLHLVGVVAPERPQRVEETRDAAAL